MLLGYLIIYVEDVEATLAHYARAFELETTMLHESKQYGELATGSAVLAFAAVEEAEGNGIELELSRLGRPAQGYELVLVTPDVARAYARAVDNGATAVRAPEEKPWNQTVAYVRDINGVLVELASPILPQHKAP
ncbi:MAG: VOC family protein [Myxococcota bacterium]